MKLMTNSPFSRKMVPLSLAAVQKAVSNQNLCRESHLKTQFFSYFLRKFDGQIPFVRPNPKRQFRPFAHFRAGGRTRPWSSEKRKTIATVDIDNGARILNSGLLYLLHIQPGLAPGTGLRFVHPRLPSIVAFGTFHLFHINTVVIRVLITFDCI